MARSQQAISAVTNWPMTGLMSVTARWAHYAFVSMMDDGSPSKWLVVYGPLSDNLRYRDHQLHYIPQTTSHLHNE